MYLLRRCPVADLDAAEQFYNETFDKDNHWKYRKNGVKLPDLWIRKEGVTGWCPFSH